MKRVMRVPHILGVAILLAVLAFPLAHHAPAAAAQTPSEVFVGRVAYSDIFVGVAVVGGDVIAYACDGTDLGVSVREWFRGTVGDGEGIIELSSPTGALLTLDFRGGAPGGQLMSAAGVPVYFSTEPAVGEAGIYRAEGTADGEPFVAGWIVQNTGEVRGAFGTGFNLTGLSLSSLNLMRLTAMLPNLLISMVAKVGITPIPIP
jgi:hypothetical protein